jgi:3-oxoacyl-[acyl-carrier protein] reductase
MVITGTSRGIGKYLASYYCEKGFTVIGCSKKPLEYQTNENYHHFCLDIHDEKKVKELFSFIRKRLVD